MWQVIFRIPIPGLFPQGVPVYGFGLMLFVAFIVCVWFACKRGEREGISNIVIQDTAMFVFLGGLLGARITYLIGEEGWRGWKDFLWRLPQIWEGGIVLYGSIIGGVISYFFARYVYFLYFRKENIPTRRFLDVIAPCVALGLCFGRFGCFLNGCCYGGVACASCAAVTPVGFPLCAPPRDALVRQGYQTVAGFTLDPRHPDRVQAVDPNSAAYTTGLRPGAIITAVNGKEVNPDTTLDSLLGRPSTWPRGETALTLTYKAEPDAAPETQTFVPRTLGLYPTQLYEVVSMALLMLLLLAHEPFRNNPGQVCAVLMVGYGIHRYLNEILRDDPRPEGLESYGSVFLVTVGVLMWLWLWRKQPDPPATPIVPEKASAAASPA